MRANPSCRACPPTAAAGCSGAACSRAGRALFLALLAAACAAVAGLANTAVAATIAVTTTADELDFVPNDRCSLREAVVTVNERRALGVGGCTVSGTLGSDDLIVVPAGTYRLTRITSLPLSLVDQDADNLDLLADVTIRGAGAGSTAIDGGELYFPADGVEWPLFEGGVVRVSEGVTARIERVTLRGGRAMWGGGVHVGGSLTLVDLAVEGNTTKGPGAGIYNEGSLTLRRVTVSGNESDLVDATPARVGGGIYTSGSLDALNVTISGNRTIAGGGLSVAPSAGLTLLDSVTVTGNVAVGSSDFTYLPTGGIDNLAPASQVRVQNSVVAGNQAPGDPDCYGAFDSRGHNLVGDVGGCTGFSTGDQRGSADDPIDPLLAPLANYGGQTKTHALLPGSPAVDGGPLPASGDCPDTDQRGFPRGLDGDGDGFVQCDVGAYEGPAGMSADANLAVTLLLEPNPVAAGGTLELSVTVRNNGPGAADGVGFGLALPAGAGPVLTMPGGCSANGGTVTCSLPDLDAGDQVTRAVTATAPTSLGVVIAEVTVTSDSTDPEPGDDTAQATTLVVGAETADLSLTMAGPSSVETGDSIAYVLTARNAGPQDAGATAHVTYSLPANVTFVSATTGCSRVSSLVNCPVPGLGAGQSRSLSVVVRAPAQTGHVYSTATVVGEPGSDGDLSNNNASFTTRVDPPPPPSADLFVQKLGPATAQVGSQVTYNIVVHNNGPDAAEDVRVTDELPPGVSVVSVPADCGVADGTVTCDVGAMQPFGTTVQYQVVVTAPEDPGVIRNEASIVDLGGSLDPYPVNDASGVTTTVTAEPPPPGADLAISKGGPLLVQPGAEFAYSLVVTNNGPDPAANVVVSDDLPVGVTLTSVPGGCAVAGGTVTCALASLAAGATAAFALEVTAPTVEGQLVNTATVASDTEDGVPDNDSDTVATEVTQAAPGDAPSLSLESHPEAAPARSARPGDEGVTALRFVATAGGAEGVAIRALDVSFTVQGGTTGLMALRLYADAGDDGAPDGEALAVGSFAGGANDIVLDVEETAASTVPAGATRSYLLLVDVDAQAAHQVGSPWAALAALGLVPLGLLGRRRAGRLATLGVVVLALCLASCRTAGPTYQLTLEGATAVGETSGRAAEVSGTPLKGARVTLER